MNRPDILIIKTDQQTRSAMSCAGNPHLHTPSLDALAARGVQFTRAYTCQPLCLPARTAMQTSLFPHETGVRSNGRQCHGEFAMLGNLMRETGYRCGYFGKWHVGVDWPESDRHGYEYGKTQNWCDHDLPSLTQEFLTNSDDRPTFCTVSFNNPHEVCQLARGQALPHQPLPPCPEDPELLPPLPSNFKVPLVSALQIAQAAKREFHYPTANWSELDWRRYLWGYYRLVERVDQQIGEVLEHWHAATGGTGMILFLADHGEGVAAHHWNQKQALFEETIGVPCLLSWPDGPDGKVPCGVVSDSLVDATLDLMPTVLQAAGVPAPAACRGVCMPYLNGNNNLNREKVICETTFAGGINESGVHGRCLITPEWKYVCYNRGEDREMLFQISNDSGETTNVLDQHTDQGQLMRQALGQWMHDTDDQFGQSWYTVPT